MTSAHIMFLKRLSWLALALIMLAAMLAVNPISRPPWWDFLALFVIGALVLHKQSRYLKARDARSALRAFLKASLIYFLPASLIWFFVDLQFFTRYLPRLGIVPAPLWSTVSVSLGVLFLARLLLGREISKMQRRHS